MVSQSLPPLSAETLSDLFCRYTPAYEDRDPVYQLATMEALRGVWLQPSSTTLDIGGGTGLMAESIRTFLPAGEVTCVDVVDRFYEGLNVKAQTYDGRSLSFEDGAFEAATMINVLHHVPIVDRSSLLREVRRAVQGPLYVKDHLPEHLFDHLRLLAMDAIGNLPFGGQVWARYLDEEGWSSLASAAGYEISARAEVACRRGVHSSLFPNRLEIVLRLDPLAR